MAQINNILRYYAVYLNGVGYMGEASEVKLPDLKMKSEEFRGGGMDMGVYVDLGMDPLQAEFKMFSYDPDVLARFGRYGLAQSTPLTFRAHLMGQGGQVATLKINMDVRLCEVTRDNWKAGSKTEVNYKCWVDFYEEFHNERRVLLFDPLNFHRTIDGVDMMSSARLSLGLTTATQ
ncbi:MAG: phage major tail tube protein [Bacteroidota bacterium]